jgi:hypothetical protein
MHGGTLDESEKEKELADSYLYPATASRKCMRRLGARIHRFKTVPWDRKSVGEPRQNGDDDGQAAEFHLRSV